MRIFQLENAFFEQLAGVERKKYLFELRIVKYLYINGSRSSMEVGKQLRISTPNTFSLLNDLTDKGLIEKKGRGDSIGGRKPDLYGLRADCFYVMAVEMNIYSTRIAIFNSNNENLTGIKEFPLTMNNEPETLDMLVTIIQQFIKHSGIKPQRLTGIGISMPGLVDSVGGINHTYLKYGDIPLVHLMEDKLQVPVFIENDANSIALAEYRLGLAKSKKEILVLYMDWGIGLGMILNGKLYRGVSGFAGEFSHIQMEDDGKLCRCGKLGCLETIASGTAVVQKAEDGLASGKASLLQKKITGQKNKLELKQVIDAAMAGDQFAINLFSEIGTNLGKGISILIQLLNPELIILSGKMSEAGQYLITPIQQAIQTYTMSQLQAKTKIVLSKMGQEIGIKGALGVVMENIFESILKHGGR
jgi:N-acetylglucosamine repressor